MLRKILIAAGIVLVVGCIGTGTIGWWLYRSFTGPMYVPGTLAATAVLTPPSPPDVVEDPNVWFVADGTFIHHTSAGAGPPVVFVHGGPGLPGREPMPWLGALHDAYAVHHYDQRGCGDSTRPFDRFPTASMYPNMLTLESALGLGAQVADLERIRRLLGVERLNLVGHSFGALIATLYAAEFPDRVENLVLLAPANMLVMPAEDDFFAVVRASLAPERRAEFDAALEAYLDFGTLFAQDEAALAQRSTRLGAFILEAMDRPPLSREDAQRAGGWMPFACYLSMGRHHDYTPALEAITAETLIVHAADDLQSIDVCRAYERAILGARVVTIEGADHFFDGDHPRLAEAVRAVLDE